MGWGAQKPEAPPNDGPTTGTVDSKPRNAGRFDGGNESAPGKSSNQHGRSHKRGQKYGGSRQEGRTRIARFLAIRLIFAPWVILLSLQG